MAGAKGGGSLRELADAAIEAPAGELADRAYADLLEGVRQIVGDGEKEIAAELQRLAQEIEAAGRQAESFQFKQRTCALLLEMSMTARVRAPRQTAVPPAGSERQTAALDTLLIGTADFPGDLEHYAQALDGKLGWLCEIPGERAANINVSGAPWIVLFEGLAPGWLPVFSIADVDAFRSRMEAGGWVLEDRRLQTPRGEVLVFAGEGGRRLAVCGR